MRKAVEELFALVMRDRRHDGWMLRWAPDGYCWRTRKIIDLGEPICLAESQQWLLHEIAHIEVVHETGNQHSPEFFAKLRFLVKCYLDEELDQNQLDLERIYCPGSSED